MAVLGGPTALAVLPSDHPLAHLFNPVGNSMLTQHGTGQTPSGAPLGTVHGTPWGSAGLAPTPSSASYSTSITGDPIYRQTQADVAAQNQDAQGQATAGFGQALAGYGQIPDLQAAAQQLGLAPGSPLLGLLMKAAQDPNTVAAANALTQSGVSAAGQLAQGHDQGMADINHDVARRGAATSGDVGVELALQNRGDTAAQYKALQTLLGHLSDVSTAYNTSQQAGIKTLQTGAAQATARNIANNPAIPPARAAAIASTIGVT